MDRGTGARLRKGGIAENKASSELGTLIVQCSLTPRQSGNFPG